MPPEGSTLMGAPFLPGGLRTSAETPGGSLSRTSDFSTVVVVD
jgi:hypothetical protein